MIFKTIIKKKVLKKSLRWLNTIHVKVFHPPPCKYAAMEYSANRKLASREKLFQEFEKKISKNDKAKEKTKNVLLLFQKWRKKENRKKIKSFLKSNYLKIKN